MLDVLFQLDFFGQLIEIAVDANPDEAAFLRLLQHLHMLALAALDHRGQQLDFRPLGHGHDLIYHLVYTLLLDLLAAFRAMGDTDPGIEQSEIIVNLRHGSHSGAGVPVRRLLVDGNGRRQAVNALHIGLLHLTQELTGIG